jgi:hypothetical protein
VSAAWFLLLVVVISVVGTGLVYLRQRPPRSDEANIDSYRRGLEALGDRPFRRRQ